MEFFFHNIKRKKNGVNFRIEINILKKFFFYLEFLQRLIFYSPLFRHPATSFDLPQRLAPPTLPLLPPPRLHLPHGMIQCSIISPENIYSPPLSPPPPPVYLSFSFHPLNFHGNQISEILSGLKCVSYRSGQISIRFRVDRCK